VIFDAVKSRIFERRDLCVRGRAVHNEARDPLTGLYPLTLHTALKAESGEPGGLAGFPPLGDEEN